MKLKDSIILVVVFIMAIALGVFVGMKVTERKTDNSNNNQPTQSENDNKTTNMSTTEAEKIMSKYKFGACRDYIEQLSEANKLRVTINNATSTETRNCSDKSLENAATYDSGLNSCHINHSSLTYPGDDKLNLYKYSELLNTKRSLFGSNETLEKKDLEMSLGVVNYISGLDSYIFDDFGACSGIKSTSSSIVSAKITDGILRIRVSNTSINSGDVSTKDEYEYVFKKANNDYYLAEITEVK